MTVMKRHRSHPINTDVTAHGTPRLVLDRRTPFWDRVRKTDGCWEWIATKNAYGYGVFVRNGSLKMAHRLSYEELVGPIPEGMQIDHLCRNPACINPAHLEAVTQRVNLLRGVGISARNAARTHCPQGHIYSDENTYLRKTSSGGPARFCKICARFKSKWFRTRRQLIVSGLTEVEAIRELQRRYPEHAGFFRMRETRSHNLNVEDV